MVCRDIRKRCGSRRHLRKRCEIANHAIMMVWLIASRMAAPLASRMAAPPKCSPGMPIHSRERHCDIPPLVPILLFPLRLCFILPGIPLLIGRQICRSRGTAGHVVWLIACIPSLRVSLLLWLIAAAFSFSMDGPGKGSNYRRMPSPSLVLLITTTGIGHNGILHIFVDPIGQSLAVALCFRGQLHAPVAFTVNLREVGLLCG